MATERPGAMDDNELYDIIAQDMGFDEEAEEANQESENPEPSPEQDVEDETPKEVEEQEESTESETEETESKWIPSTIEELAEALEVEADALKAIRVKTKVDGVESDVPLGEVIKNYQINKSLTDRSEQLAHNRKALEQAVVQFNQQRESQLAEWQAWSNVLESRLKEQVSAIDWKQLREEDPAEYAAKRQEFTERIAEMEGMKKQFTEQQQAAMYQAAIQRQEQFKQVVQENIKQLPSLIPEFSDTERMKTEMKDLQNYLGKYFQPEEINTVYDARHIAVARKAMLYDKLMEKGAPKLEKIKEKPKFVKPAARNTQASVANKQSQTLYKKALKSQRVDDWVSVIAERL